jgi:hypothetical protein
MITATDTSTLPSLPSEIASHFKSFREMKEYHWSLLQRGEHSGEADLTREVKEFLSAGSALGQKLSLPAERGEAQRLLDYWVSTLSSPDAKGQFALRKAILEPYAAGGEQNAADAAAELVRRMTADDQRLAKRIILRLLELEADGTSFALATRAESLLVDGPNPRRSAEILSRFKECGLIVATEENWALCGSAVLTYWEQAREWLGQRRRLRGAARFWDAHGRASEALLEGGDLLDEAASYLDLNELEAVFVDQSKVQRDQRHRKERAWLIGGLAGLAILCAGLVVSTLWAFSEMRTAKTQTALATKEKTKIGELMGSISRQNTELLAQNDEIQHREKKTRADYEALLGIISSVTADPQLPEHIKGKLAELVNTLEIKASLPVYPKTTSSTQGLTPGVGLFVRSGGREWQGTAGFFLEDPRTKKKYVVGPGFLLSGLEESKIYRTDRIGSFPGDQALIATTKGSDAEAKNPIEDLVVAELKPAVEVRNVVPSVGTVSETINVPDLVPDSEVVMVGLGSGIKRGKIIEVESNSGMLITTRVSTAGDSGAPVVTPKGKIIGILIGSKGTDQSRVIALAPFLKRSGLRLLVTDKVTDSSLDGVMVQLIIPASEKALLPKLKSVQEKLRQKGIQLPDGEVLLRKRTPDQQTEVRYYYEEDRTIASALAAELLKLLNIQARVSRVDDSSAPHKMIQISFALPDLNRAVFPAE